MKSNSKTVIVLDRAEILEMLTVYLKDRVNITEKSGFDLKYEPPAYKGEDYRWRTDDVPSPARLVITIQS